MRGIDPNLALVMIFVLACLGFFALPACTPTATVQHEVPQLQSASDSIRKTSDSIRNAIDKMASAPMQCPKLAMPAIPENCVIDIRGETMTASSKECEDLVRFYVRARQLLKPVVHSTTKP